MRTDTGLVAAWQRRSRSSIVVAAIVALAARAALACVGDCKGAGTVDIADLIVGVNIALGSQPVTDCEAFANPAGAVDIAQLTAGVSNALNGCVLPRFVDNGDGTITDKRTGLMWEKKVGVSAGADPKNLQAADNTYPWAGACAVEGNLCQTNAAAAAACRQGTQGDQSACATCPPDMMGVSHLCLLDTAGAITIWDWILQLNAANFGGYADWRIPTAAELESIVSYTTINPAVDPAFNGTDCGAACTDLTNPACSCTQYQPGTPLLGPYWSATAAALPYSEWWFVEFGYGGVDSGGNLGASFGFLPSDAYVRAVRGGGAAASMSRFVDNGDGTTSDKQTGLMWEQKVGVGAGADAGNLHAVDDTYTWAGQCSATAGVLCQPNAAASAACAQGSQRDRHPCDAACERATGLTCPADPCVTCQPDQGACVGSSGAIATVWDWLTQLNAAHFAGHADWRVPTEAELLSIADYTVARPALDSAFGEPACDCGFPGSCGSYWSATTADNCPSLAWLVTFDWGEVYSGDKSEHLRVRAVRGGS